MKITQLIGVLISIVLLILGNVLENPYIGVLATLMFWLVFLVKMLKNWRKNILPFFFFFALPPKILPHFGHFNFCKNR